MNPVFRRWRIGDSRCTAIYDYHDVKELLYQFKGCGDIELAPVFFEKVASLLRLRYRDYWIIPAPSSKSHDEKRGFNQVVEMVKPLGLPILDVLEKTAEVKQSDLTAEERKEVWRVISFKGEPRLNGKKILLVDDVYTTGSTIRACRDLLKKEGCKIIEILVMARTQLEDNAP